MFRPGPGAPAGTLYRFSFHTMDPVEVVPGSLRRIGLVFDGVASEGFVGAATIATHPISTSGVFSDHFQLQARSFDCEVYVATPLQGDAPVGASAALAAESVEVDFNTLPSRSDNYAEAIRVIDDRLRAMLGQPATIFSARHGRLDSFGLISYSSRRDRLGKIAWTLSFQEIRKASEQEVVVPVIPRAAKQERPKNSDCNVDEEAIRSAIASDESIAYAERRARLGQKIQEGNLRAEDFLPDAPTSDQELFLPESKYPWEQDILERGGSDYSLPSGLGEIPSDISLVD